MKDVKNYGLPGFVYESNHNLTPLLLPPPPHWPLSYVLLSCDTKRIVKQTFTHPAQYLQANSPRMYV
jgi:hypothetical protein